MSKKTKLQTKYDQACELAELLKEEAFDVLKTMEALEKKEDEDGKESGERKTGKFRSKDGDTSRPAKGN